MKRIGIIGGLGPESTIDYYKGISKFACSQSLRPGEILWDSLARLFSLLSSLPKKEGRFYPLDSLAELFDFLFLTLRD